MLHPIVFNTSEVCYVLGVRHAVMSPGSRNAPLIISFARNKRIKKWIIPDERAAGFIGLGIAQKTKGPVVLCCTSGTALLNYAPAVAEAYYREIPLIVLSADRPPELIDQRDGQTIRQFDAIKNHVKYSAQLPLLKNESDENTYKSKLIDGLKKANTLPLGPVHINIPFREPFYPSNDQQLTFNTYPIPLAKPKPFKMSFPKVSYAKVLILIGQQPYSEELSLELRKLEQKLPILQSSLNNLWINGIKHADLFIQDQLVLKPELLITSGLSVLSKRLKTYLRRHKPVKHWHFDPSNVDIDTFQTKPSNIKTPLADFLKQSPFDRLNTEFVSKWKTLDYKVEKVLASIPQAEFSETTAVQRVLNLLPTDVELHLSNSMPVRFAEMLGVKNKVFTWANRGTGGIDGVTSTALGTSLVSNKLNVLLTGDLAFLYDRNAFFHNHDYKNFRIVVLNNSGGGIFRLIDGPSHLSELEEYFETRHRYTAEYICSEFLIEYRTARGNEELSKALEGFFEISNSPRLIEIFTDSSMNKKVYTKLINQVKNAT